MTRTISGTELVLTSGDYTARIVSVGAGLAALQLDGHDLVVPHRSQDLPRAWQGKTLVPWPNRITEGTYTFGGERFEVPVNEPGTGAALHGLMGWVDWRIVHADQDSATLGAFVVPRYGYPWALESWVTYAVHEDTGLSVTITSTNVGETPAPYGVSQHPFLTLDGRRVDECELAVPASRVLEVDDRLAPVALRDVGDLDLDFREARLLGAQSVDHAFTALPEEGWEVTLRDPDSGWGVAIASDAPWVQVYSGEILDRTGVAVEPMSCAPDAFNTGEGLVVLDPGASHTLTYTVVGTRAE